MLKQVFPLRTALSRKGFLLLCFIFIAVSLPVYAQTPKPSPPAATGQFDGAREYIRQDIAKENVPSVSVAVAKNGRILWEEAFGWANRSLAQNLWTLCRH